MTYIYGIYDGDQCLYVGSTSRDIDTRIKEHFKELDKGKHINKSLQKRYDNRTGDWTYKLIASIDTDNTTLKFFYECLYNSLEKPICNKCIIQQGRNRIILQRVTGNQAIELIETVNKVANK
jgi:hypothetical protein